MIDSGCVLCNSSTTCWSVGSSGWEDSTRVIPPPSRPRAKSRTLSIRPAIRTTLFCIMMTIASAGWSSFDFWISRMPGGDGGKRIAQVVPQHRDELFAKLGLLPLRGERGVAAQLIRRRLRDAFLKRRGQRLQFVARFQKLALVSPPVRRVENRQPDELGLSLGIRSFRRVDEHRKGLSVLLDEIERNFVEEALHPQQRREVGLVEDAARDVEEVVQPLADQFVGRVAGPAAKGLVGLDDAPVRPQREVPARRVLVEVFQILFDMVGLRQSRASPK